MRIGIKLEVVGLLVAVLVMGGLYALFKIVPGEPPARPTGHMAEVRFVLNETTVEKAHIDATYSNGEFDFSYTLTEAGRESLFQATSTGVGKTLMIETMGAVIARPVIKDIMLGKKTLLGLFPEQRELVEAFIKSLPPPSAPPAE